MKKIALAIVAAIALAASMPSFAQHRGYNGGYHGGYNHGYYDRGHHGGSRAGWFVGGAVVGGLLTHAYDSRPVYYSQPSVIYYREVPVYCYDYNGFQYQCGTRTVREP